VEGGRSVFIKKRDDEKGRVKETCKRFGKKERL